MVILALDKPFRKCSHSDRGGEIRYRHLAWKPFLILLLVANLTGYAFQRPGHTISSPPYGFQLHEIPEEQANALKSKYPGWCGIWNSLSGTIHRAVGPSLPLAVGGITEENVEETARHFVQENQEIFKVSGEDLRLLRAIRRSGKWFVVFDRYFKGVRVWDGRDEAGRAVSSGIYFCRLTTDNFSATVKMVRMR